MGLRPAEELAWSDYIDACSRDENLARQYIAETGRQGPVCEGEYDSEAFWQWAADYHIWLEGFRDWLTARWGYQFAPEWLQKGRAN